MMKQFLDKIQYKHVLQAGEHLVKNPAVGRKVSKTRTIIIEGRPFPPKEIIRWAYCFATSTSYDNLPREFTVTTYTSDIAQAKLKKLDFAVYVKDKRM